MLETAAFVAGKVSILILIVGWLLIGYLISGLFVTIVDFIIASVKRWWNKPTIHVE